MGWLSFIPVLGKVFDYFNKRQDVSLEKYKVDGQVDIEAVKAQVMLVNAFKDDWTIRLSRFLVVFLPSIWFGLVAWDTIMAKAYPWLMWHPVEFPQALTYYPYAVLVFLLGNAWIKRK